MAAAARRHRPLHPWPMLILEGMKSSMEMVLPHPTLLHTSPLLLLQKKRQGLEEEERDREE